MEQEVIIANNNLLFHFSKSTSFKLYLSKFFCLDLNERNSRSLLEVCRIDRFPFSIAMEDPLKILVYR